MPVARVLGGIALLVSALAGPGIAQASAQTGTVRGTVIDSTTNRGIPGAQVTITGSTLRPRDAWPTRYTPRWYSTTAPD